MIGKKRTGLPTVSKGTTRTSVHGDIEFDEGIYGNVWFRLMNMGKKGSVKKAHKHTFDHIHFVASGSVHVDVFKEDELGGVTKESMGNFNAPAWVKVPAEVAHEVTALEDDTVAICVQAVRDEDGALEGTNYLSECCSSTTTKL